MLVTTRKPDNMGETVFRSLVMTLARKVTETTRQPVYGYIFTGGYRLSSEPLDFGHTLTGDFVVRWTGDENG